MPMPALANTHGTTGVVEHDIAVGQRHREHVAHVDGVVQQRRHLTVRLPVAGDAFDGELTVLAVVGPEPERSAVGL
jgi:hypothetical protein